MTKIIFPLRHAAQAPAYSCFDLKKVRCQLGMPASGEAPLDRLPFGSDDITAGTENELQTVVEGRPEHVDLPLTIRNSSFYANLQRRVKAGDMPGRVLDHVDAYLSGNEGEVWDNSWLRFPIRLLSPASLRLFEEDLRRDKSRPDSPERSDSQRFIMQCQGEAWLRIPISYVFKLALSEAVTDRLLPKIITEAGRRFMNHYLSDNTSPETFSFHPVPLTSATGLGRAVAHETLKRYGYTQMLLQYASRVFQLSSRGQTPLAYFASTPAVKQQHLNELIPDNFYRELFMSPCLSGWEQGEDKHRYMHLCHQVLSRSQINGVKKLQEAGIITTNLVVMPNTSNISLANNGTHLSLGSRRLSALLADPQSGYSAGDEKHVGDLAIKIMEHFLPLFVGTYSAAPYRMEFSDFHPEKALGFLPHELDFTHLRMIWRRWKKKAHLKIFRQPVTPFGPQWLDKGISRLFGLRGDFLPDYRLIDYMVALMSTEQSPALDGMLGNDGRLLRDLEHQGVFDASMSLYMMMKLRRHEQMGFSGFEGRYYSLFASLTDDLAEAANLQALLSALAMKYILNGSLGHQDIPDSPSVESERRQIFFGTAIGIPTFFVRKNSPNRLMRRIIDLTPKTRASHRYSGYVRLYNQEYRRTLLRIVREDGADLIAMFKMEETIADLERRLSQPTRYAASGKLVSGILGHTGGSHPMQVDGAQFNRAAEHYYRHDLRCSHYNEALDMLEEDMIALDRHAESEPSYRQALHRILPGNKTAMQFVQRHRAALLTDSISKEMLATMIHLTTLSIRLDQEQYGKKNAPLRQEPSADWRLLVAAPTRATG